MSLPTLKIFFPGYLLSNYFIPLGILAFAILFLLFFGLSSYFVKLLSKASSLEDKKEEEYDDASEVLEEAKRQSFGIIQDANSRAGKILGDANLLGKDMSSKLDTKAQEVADETEEFLSDSAENLHKVSRLVLLEASKENMGSLREISGDFKEAMSKELVSFRESLKNSLEESQRKISEELNLYKQERKDSLDREVLEVVQRVAKAIIGKSLNVEDSGDYVFKVLEEAKKEGIFKQHD